MSEETLGRGLMGALGVAVLIKDSLSVVVECIHPVGDSAAWPWGGRPSSLRGVGTRDGRVAGVGRLRSVGFRAHPSHPDLPDLGAQPLALRFGQPTTAPVTRLVGRQAEANGVAPL